MGYVTAPESNGLYTIDLWRLSRYYSSVTSGIHTIYLRVYDKNWNFLEVPVTIDVVEPQFSLSSGQIVHTLTEDHNLTIYAEEISGDVITITYSLYDINSDPLTDDPLYTCYANNSSQFFLGTWTGVNEGDYILIYNITLSDNRTISNIHQYVYLGSASEIYGSEHTWIDSILITVDDAYPHDALISIPSDSVLSDTVSIEATWLGDGIVNSVKLMIDGSFAIFSDSTAANSASFTLDTNILSDGSHELSVCIVYTNTHTTTSDPITITVDNSAPEFLGDGVLIQDRSQFDRTILDSGDSEAEIYAMDTLNLAVQACDTNSEILDIVLTIENESTSFENTFIINDFNANFSAQIDLSTLLDGKYSVSMQIRSKGGILSSLDYLLTISRTAPNAHWITPSTPAVFSGDSITLQIASDDIEVPIKDIVFYAQKSLVNYSSIEITDHLGELSLLGTCSIPVYDHLSQNLIYQLMYDNSEGLIRGSGFEFWAKITDFAGNVAYLPTGNRHEISQYGIFLNDSDTIILDSSDPHITGIMTYASEFTQVGIPIRVELDAYNGTDFIAFGESGTYVNVDGTFSIEWNADNLPEDLSNIRIPINYLNYIGDESISLASHNMVEIGKFTDIEKSSVAIIGCESAKNTISLFQPGENSVFTWGLLYSEQQYSSYLAMDTFVSDIDNDGYDELIIETSTEFIIADWAINGTVTYHRYEFAQVAEWGMTSEFTLTSLSLKMVVDGSKIYIGTSSRIYTFEFLNYSKIVYREAIPLPIAHSLITFIWGEVISFATLIIIATFDNKYKILFWNKTTCSWNLIFDTVYELLPKIISTNLDLDMDSEILFGLHGYAGLDVIRADFNVTSGEFTFLSSAFIEDMARIYDFTAGHVAADNLGRVIIASDKGVDMALVSYEESKDSLEVRSNHNMDASQEVMGRYQYQSIDPVNLNINQQLGQAEYAANTNFTAVHYMNTQKTTHFNPNGASNIDLLQSIEDSIVYIADENGWDETGKILYFTEGTIEFSLVKSLDYNDYLVDISIDNWDYCNSIEISFIDNNNINHIISSITSVGNYTFAITGSVKK